MLLFATPDPSLRPAVLSHRVLQAQTTQGIPSSFVVALHCIALCGASGATRTLGVLAAADLDELLDIGNFGRHFGGGGWSSREKSQGSLEVRKGSRRPNRCGLA
jgi:hypothetical protein